ncbi:hypothetical protein ACIKP7_01255 [Pseudomonas caricapapayae]|uniref:Uncharacterized protein n=1 Tax=Pseudomonas caricapapayae TaxID=46678 RepID=A0ACC7LQ69_9PSED
MSSRQSNSQPGEFLPGIILPPAIHGLLRKRLAELDLCDTAVNCMILQARTESLVEALEILQAIPERDVERLYVLIDNMTQDRLAAISGTG